MKCNLLFALVFLSSIFGCRSSDSKKDPLVSIPDPKTLNESYVSNPDNILSAGTVRDLNATLSGLDQSGRAHIDVVIVKSIGEMVPKDAANKLFNKWKIGSAETNNGLLILVVLDQRRMEFETGYGLEGDLPDVTCHDIQQEYMVGHARNNDYDAALREGVAAIIRKLNPSSVQSLYDNGSGNGLSDTSRAESGTSPLVADTGMQDADITQPAEDMQQAVPYAIDSREPYDDGSSIVRTIVMIMVYLVLLTILNYKLSKRSGGRWFNVSFIIMILVPPALAFYYCTKAPMDDWLFYRQIGIIYLSFLVYLHIHFLATGAKLASQLKNDNRYLKFVKQNEAHNRFGWTAWLFPLPLLAIYWYRYKAKMKQLRNDPYICETCGSYMEKLEEKDDNVFLEKGQQDEETVRSVDYDVWVCTGNKDHDKLIFNYKNLNTRATVCPQCNFITLMSNGSEVMERATTSSSGWGYKYRKCSSCNHETKEVYTIAKLSSSSSGSSSGSSSSSSSSGGSSGGGGAGSSW